jgi:hypothetical protein
MKKNILALILTATVTNINAQLVVDSTGYVGIGTSSPTTLLTIGPELEHPYALATCVNNQKRRALRLYSSCNTSDDAEGLYVYSSNYNSNCYGINSIASGNYTPAGTTPFSIGVSGLVGNGTMAVGVFGGVLNSSSNNSSAAVYGAELGTSPSFSNYPGNYAGYFKGKVRVTNGIYATLFSPSASMSSTGQNGNAASSAIVLSEKEESISEKLGQIQTLQFLRYNPESVRASDEARDAYYASFAEKDLKDLSIDEIEKQIEEMKKVDGEIEPKSDLPAIQYGLDAEQLKKFFPELVYEDENGNVSINYVEMVPLLVQSINELSQELAELKGTSAKKAKSKAKATTIDETASDVDMVRMDQNKPNPFSESTVITLNIPEKTQKANIFIYDMSGKQVQAIPVNERGETNITVYASELTAGMYIYTLVVDGKVVVTRKMIVSEA